MPSTSRQCRCESNDVAGAELADDCPDAVSQIDAVGTLRPTRWQRRKSGGPYGPYSIFSPRYGPYSKVGTYSIEDNIDLILAWVHTNRPPIRKTFFFVQKLHLDSNPDHSDPGAELLNTALCEE